MTAAPVSGRPIGVLSAIPEEFAHLDEAAGAVERIGDQVFTHGVIAGRDAWFVECGIGKVNAAMAATLLLSRFGCGALMFCGVAGGLDPALGVGDVVVATRNLQHDYGALVDGQLLTYQAGVPPLPGIGREHGYDVPAALVEGLRRALAGTALPALAPDVAGGRTPAIRFGTVVSGDTFINCEGTRQRLFDSYGGVAVEMEGGAVAQICARFGETPFVNVRCLSDLAGAESHLDFRTFLPVAAGLAATVLRVAAKVV
ncbi:MAG: 5'-methylthioadenosine/S-adenosylhomocysteine nucleosidase [Rhodospirillales bacterium]|nr:5'-methylthioadenosine/S-adenosylhomocysteine nucleosidase [Rhodospirillales bacterium]QQS12032.1 MAG: 5'-methylthioadenosine/S-adenosylhomocysteine nucleosidase [Rhodospirillales bacterium]